MSRVLIPSEHAIAVGRSCVDLLLEVNSDQLELRKLLKKRGVENIQSLWYLQALTTHLQREPAMPLICSQDVYKSLSR